MTAANLLTFSRMLFSLLLLVFSPCSPIFGILYLLCGVTDVLDGFAARKLHTESEKGAKLDSAADLLFAAVYVVRVLPCLSVSRWIWIWTAIITVIKVSGIMFVSIKAHSLRIEHSFGNKITGALLFLLPLSVYVADVRYGAAVACVAATVTVIKEFVQIFGRANRKYGCHEP